MIRGGGIKGIMELAGKKILVIGLGKTGLAAARFLAGRDVEIAFTDVKARADLEALLRSEGMSGIGEIVSYDVAALSQVDLVVPSPGIPPTNPLLQEAVRRGVPVLSELELAYRFLSCPIVAVTGTNGKTTTTTLIGNILKKAGKKVFVGGNIGEPLIGFAAGRQEADFAVVEVSSFQLQWSELFCPAVAVLLNTTCDHVDYHGSFAAYREVKERIFARQGRAQLAILNADEPASAALAQKLAARKLFFSSTAPVSRGMFVAAAGLIFIPEEGPRELYPLDMVKLPGRHNLENVMAAVMAARACGVVAADIREAIADFKGLAHRIEWVAEKGGVTFYDDSKGTNVGAVARALESFSRPVVLLMGGRDKDGDFETLAPLVNKRVKALILFGEARHRIDQALGGGVAAGTAATLGEAVRLAHGHAQAGDVVLLSPGCASFDEFADYRARGIFFQKTVGGL